MCACLRIYLSHSVGVLSFTGMDITTGMDYRNGHYAMVLGASNVFYLHKMYLCSRMNSLHKIIFISI